MQALLIYAGPEAYGLEIDEVREVIPRVEVRALPWAPPSIAGLLSYRGAVVPVVDLCQITCQRPCETRLSSRIVIVRYRPPGRTEDCSLGILAERVTEIIEIPESQVQSMGVSTADAPYLGKVAMNEQGMVQLVRVSALLPDDLRERLFANEELP